MKKIISALPFAGHFCADARTRLRKKGAARSIFRKQRVASQMSLPRRGEGARKRTFLNHEKGTAKE